MALSILLVLGSGLAHAVWNLFAKQSEDKAVFLWAIYMPSVIVLLPTMILELARGDYAAGEWLLMGASAFMQAVYALLLAQTYKAGDLSQVYPIMRGMPTLLTPAAGVLLLGEKLPVWGWVGVGCMLIGFFVMVGRGSSAAGRGESAEAAAGDSSRRAVLLALGVGLCITTYTMIDKVNLGHLSPLALLEVTSIGFVLGLTPPVLKPGRLKNVVRRHKNILWIGAILSPGSYLLFLLAARTADISTIAPLREVGIVFGTLLGLFVLKEAQGARRLAASAIVVTGILTIALAGH